MITTLIWDFNGTVMDDLGASVGAVNAMLARRGLPPITREWYTLHLVMPLDAFYAGVGFDMQRERLVDVSEEFQRECRKLPRPVFPEVRAALERFSQKGMRQLLFSSLYHDTLLEQARERQIQGYFQGIEGLKDRSLGGKEQAVSAYLKAHSIDPKTALVIGDLTTDCTMANYVGAPCALIARGHQHKSVLAQTNAYVLDDATQLDQLLERLK